MLVRSAKGWRAEIESVAGENIKSLFCEQPPAGRAQIKANSGNRGCVELGNLRASATGLCLQVQ